MANRKMEKFTNKVQNIINDRKMTVKEKVDKLEKWLRKASPEEIIILKRAIRNIDTFNYQVCKS